MNRKSLKSLIFALFMFLAILTGSARSFAQDDSTSDEQAREDQTQQTLNQIHDLEVKMQENSKRLDDLENAVNQKDTEATVVDTANAQPAQAEQAAPVEEAPAQVVAPVEEAPAQEAAAPVQATAPVQLVSAKISPEDQSMAEIKAEPVDVLPQAPIYYAPITSFPKEHTFELSQEIFYSTFKETGDYEIYRKSGEFYGLNMAYTYRPLDSENWPINVYHVDVHGDYGLLDYNYEGNIKNVGNYIVEPRAWLGKDFNFGSFVSLTPYVGAGYRWYYDELKNKEDGEGDGGFNIRRQYVYIPLGATLSVHPADGWRVDLNGEYDFLVWGNVTNYLSEYGVPGLSNVTNTSSRGYGIRGSIKIVKEENSVNYFVEPYVRYWNIKASDTEQILYDGVPVSPYQEDKNSTVEAGARIGVEF